MNNIVLIWVWWAWVSAVARLFLWCGIKNIVGIDSAESELAQQLQAEGLSIKIWHGSYTIDPDDVVIYSSAAIDSPEVQEARRLFEARESIRPPFSYFEFLGEISKHFKTIAVAGTHGKSTTTALAAHTLATHHPDFGLGIVWAGLADRWWANMKIWEAHHADIATILQHIIDPKQVGAEHLAKKYLFVIEACEYNYQFLTLDVDIAVITNIELDHADVYGTFENYLDTFVKFCKKVKTTIITLEGTQGINKIKQNLSPLLQGEFWKKRVSPGGRGGAEGGGVSEIPITQFNFQYLLGSHNHANATLALEVCTHLSPSPNEVVGRGLGWGLSIKKTIESFTWLRRRGELLSTNTHGVPIITDYAHHPTELASTMQAMKEKYQNQKITLIFQPHQARRVVEFRDEFIDILKTITDPIIYTIYTAREQVSDITWYNIQSQYLQGEVQDIQSFDDLGNLFVQQCNGTYITEFQEIQKTLDTTTEWVILICTAGNLDWEVRKFITP